MHNHLTEVYMTTLTTKGVRYAPVSGHDINADPPRIDVCTEPECLVDELPTGCVAFDVDTDVWDGQDHA